MEKQYSKTDLHSPMTQQEQLSRLMDKTGDDRVERLTEMLETTSLRYYVYDNPNLTLPEVRSKAMDPRGVPTWKPKWDGAFRHIP